MTTRPRTDRSAHRLTAHRRAAAAIAACAVTAWLAAPRTASAQERPDGLTIGIGAGVDLPSDITDINIASVRLRLPVGLVFEPRVELGYANDAVELGGVNAETGTTALALATNVRIPIIGRGKVDLVGLGGAAFEYLRVNPDGNDNNTTSNAMAVVWGLSVEYWFSPHVTLSLTATNPVFSRQSTTDELGGGNDMTTTTTAFALVFDPNVDLMLHLYY